MKILGQKGDIVGLFAVKSSGIGGFQQKIIGLFHLLRIPQKRLAGAAHIAAANKGFGDAVFGDENADGRRAKQMPYIWVLFQDLLKIISVG